ncbi:MAG: hypothetical protein Q4B26_02290 [Eubacteriales bacterium]|nr:hypothetical protein [Eubacteriales bacterium]
MINHLFDRVEIYCAEHKGLPKERYGHLKMIPLEARNGAPTTYVCPMCLPYSENNKDGYGVSEIPCKNQVTFHDLVELVEKLGAEFERARWAGAFLDYTGYVVKYRGIEARVATYNLDKIRLDIRNTKELPNAK